MLGLRVGAKDGQKRGLHGIAGPSETHLHLRDPFEVEQFDRNRIMNPDSLPHRSSQRFGTGRRRLSSIGTLYFSNLLCVWLTRIVRRTGKPERVGGTDLLPLWRATLSGEPDASWRHRFARAAHIDGLFAGRRITFEGPSLVFEIERAAFIVARWKPFECCTTGHAFRISCSSMS